MSYAQAKRKVMSRFPNTSLKTVTTRSPVDRSYEYERDDKTIKVDLEPTTSKKNHYTVLNSPDGLSLHGKHTFRSKAKAWIAAAVGL